MHAVFFLLYVVWFPRRCAQMSVHPWRGYLRQLKERTPSKSSFVYQWVYWGKLRQNGRLTGTCIPVKPNLPSPAVRIVAPHHLLNLVTFRSFLSLVNFLPSWVLYVLFCPLVLEVSVLPLRRKASTWSYTGCIMKPFSDFASLSLGGCASFGNAEVVLESLQCGGCKLWPTEINRWKRRPCPLSDYIVWNLTWNRWNR